MRKLPVVWITLSAFGGVLFLALGVLLFARVDEKRKGRGETIAEHPLHVTLPHEVVLKTWRLGNGMEVESGTPLVEIEVEEWGRELDHLVRLVEKKWAAHGSLERERMDLLPRVQEQTTSTYAFDIEKARAQLEEAEINLKVNLDLHAQGMIAEVVLKKAEKAVDVRRAELSQAESRLKQYAREAPLRTEALQRETRTLEAEIQELEHRIQTLEGRRATPVLTSPCAGVVAGIQKQPGDRVAAGEVLCAVLDPGDLLFAAQFRASDYPHLAVGQRALITFDAFPHPPFERIEGTVIRPPSPQGEERVLVYIAPAQRAIRREDGGSHPLLPGLPGEARVIIRSRVTPAEMLLDKWNR